MTAESHASGVVLPPHFQYRPQTDPRTHVLEIDARVRLFVMPDNDHQCQRYKFAVPGGATRTLHRLREEPPPAFLDRALALASEDGCSPETLALIRSVGQVFWS